LASHLRHTRVNDSIAACEATLTCVGRRERAPGVRDTPVQRAGPGLRLSL